MFLPSQKFASILINSMSYPLPSLQNKCLFCHYRMIELKQFNEDNCFTYQSNDFGMKCSLCNGFTCIDCLSLLSPLVQTKISSLHKSTLKYASDIKQFVQSHIQPQNFIGHCCLIQTNMNPKSQESEETKSDLNTNEARDKTILLSTSKIYMGGFLSLPEFQLFIDQPINVIDVHGLASDFLCKEFTFKTKKQKIQLVTQAYYHAVIDDNQAKSFYSKNITPNICSENNHPFSDIHLSLKINIKSMVSDFFKKTNVSFI